MLKHQWFDLRLHSDDELGTLLNTTIIERATLHEWPLSCVQRIVTAEGQRWIYKTQTGPSLEALFHGHAQWDLLAVARTIYQQEGHVIMLFEHIDAPLIKALNLSAEAVAQIGRDVQQQMQAIRGNLPVLFDVSGPVKWRRMVIATANQLRTLITGGQFQQVTKELVAALQYYALSGDILSATLQKCGLVHGDLTGDNLFILPDGRYKLIDWARPFRGPMEVDLAALLESLGHDPLAQVDRSIVTMLYMLRIDWLTQCATRWFPDGMAVYDQQIAALIGRIAGL